MFLSLSDSTLTLAGKWLVNYKRILLPMCFFLIVAGCATTRVATHDQISAYNSAMAGKPDEARTILKRSEKNSFSKFFLACIELSEGNLVLARHYADEFAAAQPTIPDGKVLIQLIEQRKTYPLESWPISFASAWKASGKPELSKITDFLFDGLITETTLSEKCKLPEGAIGSDNELLAAVDNRPSCDQKKIIELSLAHSSVKMPVSIRLLALAELDYISGSPDSSECEGSKLPPDLIKQADEKRHEVVKQLYQELPLDIEFAMMAILDRTADKEKFSTSDIEEIEKAVSRPRLSPLPLEIYKDYFTRFVALGSSNPYVSAAGAARSVDHISYLLTLRRKIMATAKNASPELNERLFVILGKVVRAQIRHRTLTELLISLSLIHSASELRGGQSLQQYKAIKEFARGLIAPVAVIMSSVIWPIRPLINDSIELQMKDDIVFHQLFADKEAPTEYLNLLIDPH